MLRDKIQEYRKNIDTLREMTGDETQVFEYMIDLGKKLQKDPLSEEKRTEQNKVTRCQFDMYVDLEDGVWRAYSNGMISSGYAYILLDVFNAIDADEASQVKLEDFNELGIKDLLSMNRANGFYEMIDIMRRNALNATQHR